jgi:hypothetical protein
VDQVPIKEIVTKNQVKVETHSMDAESEGKSLENSMGKLS